VITYVAEVHIPAKLEDVFSCCASRDGFLRQFPFKTNWVSGPDSWQHGDVLDFRYRLSGFWMRHCAEIVEFKHNELFVDQMTNGLYRHFRHTHHFTAQDGGTCVRDEIEFSFGFGRWIDRLIGLPTLQRTFQKRHASLLKEFAQRRAR
jgi:ligand-binding SRPBCC domain-containing protein